MALTDGIVGCWSPSLGASGYRLLDRSGRGNHGTLTNMDAGTDWVGTSVGLALDFDGTNDQVQTTGTLPTTTARSVFQWVFASTLTNNRYSFGAGFSQSSQGWFFGLEGSFNLTVTQYGASIRDPASFPGSTWQHIGATNIGTDWVLYRNGRSVASGTMTTVPTAHPIFLGSYGGGGYWPGQIGETVVLNRALAAAEVAELYRRGNGAIGRELTGQTRRRTYGFVAATGARRRRILCGDYS